MEEEMLFLKAIVVVGAVLHLVALIAIGVCLAAFLQVAVDRFAPGWGNTASNVLIVVLAIMLSRGYLQWKLGL